MKYLSMYKKIILIFLGIFLGLVLSEGSLRIWAESTRRQFEHKLLKNEDANADLRILCIGDSVTEGGGCVSDSRDIEKSYPAQLEKKLIAKSNKNIVVINKGLSGSALPVQFNIFKQEIEKYHYDVAIFLIGAGFWSMPEFATELTKLVSLKWKIVLWIENLLSKFKVYKLVKNGLINLHYRFFILPSQRQSDKVPEEYFKCVKKLRDFRHKDIKSEEGEKELIVRIKECISYCEKCDEAYYEVLDIFGSNEQTNGQIVYLPPKIKEIFESNSKRLDFLKNYSIKALSDSILTIKKNLTREIIDICKRRNIKAVFLNYPAPELHVDIEEFIQDLAEKNGYLFIDLRPFFTSLINQLGFYECFNINRMHPTCKGYERMAEKISEELIRYYNLQR